MSSPKCGEEEVMPKSVIIFALTWEQEDEEEKLSTIAMRFDKAEKNLIINTFIENRRSIRLIGPLTKKQSEYNEIESNAINNFSIGHEVWRLTSRFKHKYTTNAIKGIVRYIFVDINKQTISDFFDLDKSGKKIANKIYQHDVENYDVQRFVDRIKALLVLTYVLIGKYNKTIEDMEYDKYPIDSFRTARRLLLKVIKKEL